MFRKNKAIFFHIGLGLEEGVDMRVDKSETIAEQVM
jgi:hypothetical protein